MVKVVIGRREYESIEALMSTDSALDATLKQMNSEFGDQFRPWWYNSTVRFVDGRSASSSMVEVQGVNVLVGVPAHYRTFTLDTVRQALVWADEIADEWMGTSESHREFVDRLDVGASLSLALL